jgi:hypothetical protein
MEVVHLQPLTQGTAEPRLLPRKAYRYVRTVLDVLSRITVMTRVS